MTLLPGLLVVPMVWQMMPRSSCGLVNPGPRAVSVAFAVSAAALGVPCIIIGVGAISRVPAGGGILLMGGMLLAVGMPAAEWVERREQRPWA